MHYLFCWNNRSFSKSSFFLCPLRCLLPCSVFVRVLPLFQFHLLQLLLWPEAVGVTTLLLTAVHGARMETGVAQPEIVFKLDFMPRSLDNLQIILSQLYFWASRRREGSMTPPRSLEKIVNHYHNYSDHNHNRHNFIYIYKMAHERHSTWHRNVWHTAGWQKMTQSGAITSAQDAMCSPSVCCSQREFWKEQTF